MIIKKTSEWQSRSLLDLLHLVLLMIRSWKYKITDATVRVGFRLGKALPSNTGLYIQNVVGNYQQVLEVFVWITSQADVLKTRTTDETETVVVCLPNFPNIVFAVSSKCKVLNYGTCSLCLHPALATVPCHAYTISGNHMGDVYSMLFSE